MEKAYLITINKGDLENIIQKCVNKSLRLYVADATREQTNIKKPTKKSTIQMQEVSHG